MVELEDGDEFADVPIGLNTWKCYLWLADNHPEMLR